MYEISLPFSHSYFNLAYVESADFWADLGKVRDYLSRISTYEFLHELSHARRRSTEVKAGFLKGKTNLNVFLVIVLCLEIDS